MSPCFWSSDCGSVLATGHQRPPGEARGKVCRSAHVANPENVCYAQSLSATHPTSLTPSKSRLEMDWLVPTARMNEHWRGARRLLDRGLGPGATASYRRMMEDKTHLFLGQLLEAPEDFLSHIGLSVRCTCLVYLNVNHWAVFKGDLSCPSRMGMTYTIMTTT